MFRLNCSIDYDLSQPIYGYSHTCYKTLQRAVLMLCAYMPDSIADKCEDYVQQYGDEIIRLIMEMEMDPDEICAELGLCSTIQMPSSNILYGKKISIERKHNLYCELVLPVI